MTATTTTAEAGTLLYGLSDRPPPPQAMLAALAHLLAIVVSIATAPLIIARGLQFDTSLTTYVISSALIISGLATLIQIQRIGPFGSGLLAIQGTSFSFIGVFIYAGSLLQNQGMTDTQVLGTLLGSACVGAACTVLGGYFIEKLRLVITPVVTGITVFLLGTSLLFTAAGNFLHATQQAPAAAMQVWLQGLVVVATIIVCATRNNPWWRLGAISLGLSAGIAVATISGDVQSVPAADTAFFTLRWLPFPLSFDLGVFLVILPIFLVTMTEAVGDLTATSMLSRVSVSGPSYWQRVRGGLMADGLNSVMAALAGGFPNTTFSQNNGVIRVTAVASRYVGYFVAGLLILLGSIPIFALGLQAIPAGVVHSTTGLLFAMIALTGLRILNAVPERNRALRMLAICAVVAVFLKFVPHAMHNWWFTLPDYLTLLLNFPVATGSLMAMFWELWHATR
ncbi:MAG: solute carrier family 23 protein [Pseudomonadota bacterium]